jgi:hypothetical protein
MVAAWLRSVKVPPSIANVLPRQNSGLGRKNSLIGACSLLMSPSRRRRSAAPLAGCRRKAGG